MHCFWKLEIYALDYGSFTVGMTAAHSISGPVDDVTADDSASNAEGICRDLANTDEFPAFGLSTGLSDKQGYKVRYVGFMHISSQGPFLGTILQPKLRA